MVEKAGYEITSTGGGSNKRALSVLGKKTGFEVNLEVSCATPPTEKNWLDSLNAGSAVYVEEGDSCVLVATATLDNPAQTPSPDESRRVLQVALDAE